MDFLIFSDSHGRAQRIRDVLEKQISRPHAVFFAGDGLRDIDAVDFSGISVHAVSGNCDWLAVAENERLISVGEHTVLLTHGHLHGVKSGYGSLLKHAVQVGADIVLFGHTHLPYYEMIPAESEICGTVLTHPLHLFNPGSIGMEGSFGTLTVRHESLLFSHGKI